MKRFFIVAAIVCGVLASVLLFFIVSDLLSPDVTEISFDMSEVTLSPGGSCELFYSWLPSDESRPSLSWRSSDESVASVRDGVVTAGGTGVAVITARAKNGVSASCTVEVAPPVSAIELSDAEIYVNRGQGYKITAFVSPEGASAKALVWSSGNESVAAVDSRGYVTGVGNGTAVISIVSDSGIRAECAVTVVTPVESLSIGYEDITLNLSQELMLSCLILPEDASDKSVTWVSSNPGIVSVDSEGRICGVSVGSAVITAVSGNGLTATCAVRVRIPAESLSLSADTLVLNPGGSHKLTCTVSPENATDKSLTWSSGDSSVVRVDRTGRLTAVALGSAEITVSCADGLTVRCAVNVEPPPPVFQVSPTLTLIAGATADIDIITENIENPRFTFSSDNAEVCTVDGAGVVTGVGAGTANVTVTVSNGMTALCSVRVLPAYKVITYTFNYPYFRQRTVTLSISTAFYEQYKSVARFPIYSDSQYATYVNDTSDDEFVTLVARALADKAAEYSLSAKQTLEMVICFVQYLEYYDDYLTTGYIEYPKFPVETLYDSGGDCEDTSILLASLLSKLGYDTVLVLFDKHMGVGIADDGTFSGTYYLYGGVKYFYIETTSTGWQIGSIHSDYKNMSAVVLTVN